MHGTSGDEAVKYAEVAIQRRYLAAYFVLGQWYLYGENTSTNSSKAIQLFIDGANAGSDSCAVHLAAMYRIGYGVEKDSVAGSKWEASALRLGASAEVLNDEIRRLETRKKLAAALGKETIDEETYRAELQRRLDGLRNR